MGTCWENDRQEMPNLVSLDQKNRRGLGTSLRHAVYALSNALDLVGIGDTAHGKRVAIMAAECAAAMHVSAADKAFAFDLGLLHDIGVSTTETHRHLLSEFDWESAQDHCEAGYALLHDFLPLARFAQPIKYHHTRWDVLTASGVDAKTARWANLIYLVDRVDTLVVPHHANNSLLMHASSIRERIAGFAGTFFSPELVDVFLSASRAEAFWLNLEPRGVLAYLAEMLEYGQFYAASMAELKQLAFIFSCIVDAKSPFTAEHSSGVARLARWLSERLDISEENCDKIEIAGLLHDIGKLRIPDEILDKPAKLDEHERKIMNAHSFETYQILRWIPGFDEIAQWAAYHHEEPSGEGYPFHLVADEMPLEARILRVADIFQAMVQDRPYRRGLSIPEVRGFMQDMVRQGRADAGIVNILLADMDGALVAARPVHLLNARQLHDGG